MASVERVFIYDPEPQFPSPLMACRDCGKTMEEHHPLYCHPAETYVFLGLLSLLGILLAVIAVAPWFLG